MSVFEIIQENESTGNEENEEKFTKCVHKFYSKQVSKILLKYHDEVYQGMGDLWRVYFDRSSCFFLSRNSV